MFALTVLLWVVVLYFLTILSTLTSCNSYYPVDISGNLFTECLNQNCPVCVDCLALNCGSVLSTILFTHTSCNFYYPVDIPCNLFTKCLFQRISLFALTVSLLLVVLYSLPSCLHWLRVTLAIQATFPVICLLNACFKELPCLHWLSRFYWLFCIIYCHALTDFV